MEQRRGREVGRGESKPGCSARRWWSSDVVAFAAITTHQAATSVIWRGAWTTHPCAFDILAFPCTFFDTLSPAQRQEFNLRKTAHIMEYFSLKRSSAADRGQANLSSKVYVRSTKSGKVQKIVRELYLRQDIPCSSNLCRKCLEIAPSDYKKKGSFPEST